MHLIIEGRGGDYNKLNSIPIVYDFINEAVRKTGLTKIIPPIVTDYNGTNPQDWGVSGIVMIAESHISIHTFPEYGEASIDLFSCKEVPLEPSLELIKEIFGFTEVEYIVIERGLEFRERGKTVVSDTGVK